MFHQIDTNDLKFVQERGYNPVGWVPCPRGVDGKINPQVTQFVTDKGSFLSVFHIKPIYYETTTGHWRPISEIAEYSGNKNIRLNEHWRAASIRYINWLTKRQALFGRELLLPTPFGDWHIQELARPILNVGLTTTTVYPDPHPENTTFDGAICTNFNASGTSLSQMQTVTSSTNHNSDATRIRDNDWQYSVAYIRAGSGQHYPIRGATLFDTSSIGSGATINSAVYSVYYFFKYDEFNDAYAYVNVVECSPASNTGWTNSDITLSVWDIATPLSTGIDITSASTSAYSDYTLNADGEAAIAVTGVTKLGMMEGHEIEQINWTGSSGSSQLTCHSAEASGTSTDPKLLVDYTAGGGGGAVLPQFLGFAGL